ncbi:MAG: cytochrome c biogenesis protein CcsA [Deltaproteobacteria bacterium]|nr:cytochrome c biogenesis protein CcsA [Deltaproteobacteria bacterium]
MPHLLLKLCTVFYVTSAFAYLGVLLAPKLRLDRLGIWALGGGITLHLASIIDRWIELELTPVTNFQEGLSAFGLALSAVFLFMNWRLRRPVIGAFVTPLIAVMMITALLVPSGGGAIPESLRSIWLPIHISMAFLGDASLAIAASAGVLYLLLERKMKRKEFGGIFGRMPSLETLDSLSYNLVRFGFVLLTLAILTGTIWAGQQWKSYFSWEPRQTSAMVVWVIFAALITSRWMVGWQGRRTAVITIVGFGLMLGSFLILRFLQIGRHFGSYT